MSELPERALFFKSSGERLMKGSEDDLRWGVSGVRAIRDKLAQVHRLRKELKVTGITVVSGAGNIARGAEMRQRKIALQYADVIGRLALIQNALVIADALDAINVPNEVMLASKMRFEDPTIKLAKYSAEKVAESHAEGKIVLIAGGTGEDNVTTDNAIVFYARDHKEKLGGEVVIMKGTNIDGVYDGNPNKSPDAKKFKRIGAPQMLREYEGHFEIVDRSSLEQLVASNLSMLVYSEGGHDLETVLRHDPRYTGNGANLGTIIDPNDIEPVYY